MLLNLVQYFRANWYCVNIAYCKPAVPVSCTRARRVPVQCSAMLVHVLVDYLGVTGENDGFAFGLRSTIFSDTAMCTYVYHIQDYESAATLWFFS